MSKSEQQRETRQKEKPSRNAGTCGTMTKALTFVSSGSQKARVKRKELKNVLREIWQEDPQIWQKK